MECPRCGGRARLVRSFYPEPGGKFECEGCGYRWSEG